MNYLLLHNEIDCLATALLATAIILMHRLFIRTILGCSQAVSNKKSAKRTVRTVTVTKAGGKRTSKCLGIALDVRTCVEIRLGSTLLLPCSKRNSDSVQDRRDSVYKL